MADDFQEQRLAVVYDLAFERERRTLLDVTTVAPGTLPEVDLLTDDTGQRRVFLASAPRGAWSLSAEQADELALRLVRMAAELRHEDEEDRS